MTYPGLTIGTDADDFAVKTTGALHIPTGGTWTFGVSSDEGFLLEIGGATMDPLTATGGAVVVTTLTANDTLEFTGTRTAGDSLVQVTSMTAADYPINLITFERSGGAEVELYAAPGTFAAVSDTNTWRLVGDTANGGIGVPKSGFVATDYKGGTPGFDVTLYKASGTVSSITSTEAMIASAALQSYATQEVAPYINYLGSGGNTVNGQIFRSGLSARTTWPTAAGPG